MGHSRALSRSFLRCSLAVVALAAIGCGEPTDEAAPRHLLLVTLDTTRADRLGCYGYADAGTPNLDALAARGVRVERAYAQTPITLPSHVSILTGVHPTRTGVHVNGQTEMTPGVQTLAEILSGHGFETAAAVGGFPLTSRFPVARGFRRFDDRMINARRPEGLERDAGEVVRAALDLLRHRAGGRLFLWVHFFDPHDPYEPPSPFRERFSDDPYQGEIARVDAALGELLSAVSSALSGDGLLVCVVGDHGEALGEHGESTHGFFIYEATMQVPLILAGPGVPVGGAIRGPVRTVDIVPTLLARLGLPVPDGLDGRILDLNDPSGSGPPVYLESELPYLNYGWSPLRGVVDGWTKLIEAPRPELYDLRDDPGETHDRSRDLPEELERLRDELSELAGGANATGTAGIVPDPRLVSLGYLSSGRPRQPGAPLPDPKDRIATYARFQSASRLLESGRPDEALAVLDELLSEEDSPGVRLKRAVAFRLLARLELAAQELDRVDTIDPEFPGLALQRLYLALANRDSAAALRFADAQLRQTPDHPEVILLRGAAREMAGDTRGAERDYLRALELNPAYRAASLRLAALLVRANRLPEARARLRTHLLHHPSDEIAAGLLDSLQDE